MKEYNSFKIFVIIFFFSIAMGIIVFRQFYYPSPSPYSPQKILNSSQIDTLLAEIIQIEDSLNNQGVAIKKNKDLKYYLNQVQKFNSKFKLDSYFQNKKEMLDYLLYFEYTNGFFWRFCQATCVVIKRDINGNAINTKLIYTASCHNSQSINNARENFWRVINN
jgi:hypothetical protein